MRILVTGAAGFIGAHLSKRLIIEGNHVVGLDNFNDYYDKNLKYSRIKNLISDDGFSCENIDLCNISSLEALFKRENFDVVVNLAAQAGVRYSITNPGAYVNSNLIGFMNILELVRNYQVPHLLYASSSSVYGNSPDIPYSEDQNINKPISLYAATKISNEVLASSYSHLYNFSSTGLRFFTVYGPWGRPDMAYFLFTKNILDNKPINVFASGMLKRDFTFIDDIIDGISLILNKKITEKRSEIFNIGNNKPILVNDFINIIEKELDKKAKINFLPMQDGDVEQTYANLSKITSYVDFKPKIDITSGISKFCKWYKDYNKIK